MLSPKKEIKTIVATVHPPGAAERRIDIRQIRSFYVMSFLIT